MSYVKMRFKKYNINIHVADIYINGCKRTLKHDFEIAHMLHYSAQYTANWPSSALVKMVEEGRIFKAKMPKNTKKARKYIFNYLWHAFDDREELQRRTALVIASGVDKKLVHQQLSRVYIKRNVFINFHTFDISETTQH